MSQHRQQDRHDWFGDCTGFWRLHREGQLDEVLVGFDVVRVEGVQPAVLEDAEGCTEEDP